MFRKLTSLVSKKGICSWTSCSLTVVFMVSLSALLISGCKYQPVSQALPEIDQQAFTQYFKQILIGKVPLGEFILTGEDIRGETVFSYDDVMLLQVKTEKFQPQGNTRFGATFYNRRTGESHTAITEKELKPGDHTYYLIGRPIPAEGVYDLRVYVSNKPVKNLTLSIKNGTFMDRPLSFWLWVAALPLVVLPIGFLPATFRRLTNRRQPNPYERAKKEAELANRNLLQVAAALGVTLGLFGTFEGLLGIATQITSNPSVAGFASAAVDLRALMFFVATGGLICLSLFTWLLAYFVIWRTHWERQMRGSYQYLQPNS